MALPRDVVGQSAVCETDCGIYWSYSLALYQSTFQTIFRVPTVREKSVKSEKSSRSGKSQGILI